MSIRVRPLSEEDKRGWSALFRAYIDFYRASVADEVIDQTWRRLTGADPNMLGLGAASSGGQLIGIVHAVFHPSTWAPVGYCYLEDLFVAPEVRGQGAGRALIEAVYREADARGATRVYWVTEEGNSTARRLYDTLATRAPFVQYRR